MGRLQQVVKEDAAFLVKAKELQQGRRGSRRSRLRPGGGGWAPDPIYGSKEVREVLYLFVWSLLRQRGSHLLTDHDNGSNSHTTQHQAAAGSGAQEEGGEGQPQGGGTAHEQDDHGHTHHQQQPPSSGGSTSGSKGGKPNRKRP